MATLYPFTKPTENKEKTDWYTVDKNQDKILKYDITEIAIVSKYTPTGNEVRWDASAERDGSVMAYITGTKVTLVLSPFTTIPARMFDSFLSLEKITGLSAVTKVEKLAFFRCFSLKDIDLDPAKLTSIGDDAFRLSCVEDILDLSNLRADASVGARATRAKRWGNELAAFEDVQFPAHKIFFDVPHADSQQKDVYKNIPFVREDSIVGDHTLYNGCSVFALYHAWNCLYAGTEDKVYRNMAEWWDATLNKDRDYAEKTDFDSDAFWQYNTSTLGWEYDRNTNQKSVESSTQLGTILNELSNGLPVNTTIQTASASHNVLIIGCDPETKKLAFVDSGVRPDIGVVYWCAFEDVYTQNDEGGKECIRLMDYNVPMLAEKDTWYTQGGTTVKRATITEIEIVQSYERTGSETASWDASADNNESVMAYVNETEDGTKLTIAGNGYRLIYANPDSSYAFSDAGATDYFSTVTSFNGGELLNTSHATNMADMFRDCFKLKTVNVSNWNVSNVTSMYRMFRGSKTSFMAFDSLDVSRWDVSSCTEMSMMFQRCDYLKSLDVSNWDTSNVTRMDNMFNLCGRLKHLDVSKWDTSSCYSLLGVFQYCTSLTELNLSNWDTSRCGNLTGFFGDMNKLQKLTLGDTFEIQKTTLPAPSGAYIPYADGYWYDHDYNAYAPADIPNGVARTYYASKFIAADDDDNMVFIRNGTLRKTAVAIRHNSGKTDTMLPSSFADEVFDFESTNGFWSMYQQNGTRTNYTYGFAGFGWNKNSFSPKYNMQPTYMLGTFRMFNIYDEDWQNFDLVAHLESLGVILDTSICVSFGSAFREANIGRIGEIDLRSLTFNDLNYAFAEGNIETIDKLIVKPELTFTNTFKDQKSLVNITFEGEIGSNISFEDCSKLSKASIESIFGALSSTTSGLTLTLSQIAKQNAFTDYEWSTLVATKPNWTISLV